MLKKIKQIIKNQIFWGFYILGIMIQKIILLRYQPLIKSTVRDIPIKKNINRKGM